MFELPELDIDELPDMEEGDMPQNIIDFLGFEEGSTLPQFKSEFVVEPKESYFKKCDFVRNGQKLWMNFEISPDELNGITKTTGGLLSAEIQEGQYCFDVDTRPNGEEDLYYAGEFVGQYVQGEPRIYKRFFIKATIHIMVRDEILIENAPGEFTIHPDFFSGLDKISQSVMSSTFDKKNSIKFNKDKLREKPAKKTTSIIDADASSSSHLEMF